jgi:pimeloyl-ACP methyl ester carboxylesterase
VDADSASILTMNGAALPAFLLAASYPDRVRSLVLWSPYARFLRGPDHPCGLPERMYTEYLDVFEKAVEAGALIDTWAPSRAGDPAKRRWSARSERLGGAPAYLTTMFGMWMRSDLLPVLDSVQVPTLVLGRKGDRDVITGHAREVADRVLNARYVEFDADARG